MSTVQPTDLLAITRPSGGDAGTYKVAVSDIKPAPASETAAGIVELATAAETTAGTDNTRAVHPQGLKVELDKKAPLASPALTGTPTAPTAAAGTKTTQLATTQFVADAQVFKRTGTTLEPATAGDTIKGPLVPTNGALGFRNVIINGDLKVNQRNVTIAAAAAGQYGPDRWKKVDAGNMTQIIEDVNFVPGATYTLSGTGVTTQQLTAPSTGHWTLPNIPITATNIQLELGPVATPFERRSYGQELVLCQRYFQSREGHMESSKASPAVTLAASLFIFTTQKMRATPTAVTYDSAGTPGKITTTIGSTNYPGQDITVPLVSVDGLNIYKLDNVNISSLFVNKVEFSAEL